jgi:hypothetical protein
MMYINVDIEDAGICAQEFEDTKDYVINIAEPGCFALLSMMKTTSPVYGYVGLSRRYSLRGSCEGALNR